MAEPIETSPIIGVKTFNEVLETTPPPRIGDDVDIELEGEEMPYRPERGDRMAEYATRGDGAPFAESENRWGNDRSLMDETIPVSSEETDEVAATRAQIEETRANLSGTIDAIKDKLSPANLMEEAKESVKAAAVHKVEEVASSVTETAKNVVASASMVASAAVAQVNEFAHSAVEVAHNVFSGASDKAKDAVESTAETASDLAHSASTTAKGVGNTIVDTIRMNPLPAALIGIGAGWLLMSMRKQESLASRYEANLDNRNLLPSTRWESESAGNVYNIANNAPSATDKVKEAISNVGDKASDLASSAKDKASDIASTAKDKVSDIASTAKDKAGDLAHTVSDRASTIYHSTSDTVHNAGVVAKDKSQQAVSALDSWVHENPVAAGAVALLVGAAVGLMLPATRKESEWMGPTRDRLADQATSTATDVVQKAQRVAEVALGNAKQSFGDAKDSLKDTIQHEAEVQGLTSVPAPQPPVVSAY